MPNSLPQVRIFDVTDTPTEVISVGLHAVKVDLARWWGRFNNKYVELDSVLLARNHITFLVGVDNNFIAVSYSMNTSRFGT